MVNFLNLKIIKDILEQKNISVNAFAKQLNMTPAGLRKILRENTTSQATLTKISELLLVPISTFYIESNTLKNSEYKELYENALQEIKRLKKQITRSQSDDPVNGIFYQGHFYARKNDILQ